MYRAYCIPYTGSYYLLEIEISTMNKGTSEHAHLYIAVAQYSVQYITDEPVLLARVRRRSKIWVEVQDRTLILWRGWHVLQSRGVFYFKEASTYMIELCFTKIKTHNVFLCVCVCEWNILVFIKMIASVTG